MAKSRFTASSFIMASLLAATLTVCCQIVGVFSPAWATIDQTTPEVRVQYGVWYSRACTSDACVISDRDYIHEQYGGTEVLDGEYWSRMKAFTLWSITQTVFAMVLMVILLKTSGAGASYQFIFFVFALFSATLSSSAMFIAVILRRTTEPTHAQSGWTTNWSRSIATTSIAPGLISTVLLLCGLLKKFVCKKKRSRRPQPPFQIVRTPELPCVGVRDVFPLPPYIADNIQTGAEPPPAYTELELPPQIVGDQEDSPQLI